MDDECRHCQCYDENRAFCCICNIPNDASLLRSKNQEIEELKKELERLRKDNKLLYRQAHESTKESFSLNRRRIKQRNTFEQKLSDIRATLCQCYKISPCAVCTIIDRGGHEDTGEVPE